MDGMDRNPARSFIGETLLGIAGNLRRIAVFCLIVALATAAYVMLVDKRWEATAVAMVPGSGTSSIPSLAGIGIGGAGGGTGGLTNLATAGSGAVGRLLGPVIDLLNNANPGAFAGYTAMFIFGAICTGASSLLLSRTREA